MPTDVCSGRRLRQQLRRWWQQRSWTPAAAGIFGGSSGGGGYSAPEYTVVEETYVKPSSGYGNTKKVGGEHKERGAVSGGRFTYQWEENIARLRRGKRGVNENVNRFIEVRQLE